MKQTFDSSLPLAAGNTLQGLAGTNSAITYTIAGIETSKDDPEGTYQILAQGVLATGNATLFTGPTRTQTQITLISLVNTSASPVTGVVISINGSAASNKILPGATIPAKGTVVFANGAWEVKDPSGNVYLSGSPALSDAASADTTPLAASTAGVATTAARSDHSHRSPGGVASITAASAAIANTETRVVAATCPADLLAVGTTFRVTAAGKITTGATPGNDTFRVRVGPTTLTGNIAAAIVAAANASITAQAFFLEFIVTVRTNGGSGTIVGQGFILSEDATTGAFTVPNKIGITTSAVAVDTTVDNLVELTFVSGAAGSSATFQNAVIEIVK